MSEEKSNNLWKQSLEDVNSLPNDILQNKDAAWEKLHARLSEKPHRKRIVWNQLAAACVLFLIIISFFTINKTFNISKLTAVNNDAKKVVGKKNESIKNAVKEKIISQTTKQLKYSIASKSKVKNLVVADTLNAKPLQIQNKQALQNQTITTSLIIDTTLTAIIPSIPFQKKLKVVHVNELGEPVEFPFEAAHIANLHLFQLKLAQQEIYNSSTIASNNTSVLSFKPKNSSN